MTADRPNLAREALDVIRNGRFEEQTRFLESGDAKCKTLQESASVAETFEAGEFITQGPTLQSHLKPLTARQLTAINLLSLGKSVVAVAASLRLDPSTIHRWKSGNPLFIAELNRRNHDAYDAIATQLRLTMLDAVGHLRELMTNGLKSEKREVMWKMLSFLKPAKLIVPDSPTEPRDVVDEKIRIARAHRGEIVEAPIEEEDRVAWVREQEEEQCGTAYQPVKAEETAEAQRGTQRQEEKKNERKETEKDHGQVACATRKGQSAIVGACARVEVHGARKTTNEAMPTDVLTPRPAGPSGASR